MYRFEEKVWGTQFHPEFNGAIATDHILFRQEPIIRLLGKERFHDFLGSVKETDVGTNIFQRFIALSLEGSEKQSSRL